MNKVGGAGFTVLELMMAIMVAGVLLALAAPSFQGLLDSQRIKAESRDFVVDFSLARNEAAARAAPVSICVSEDLENCSGTDWRGGRIMFLDPNANGVRENSELILTTHPALAASLSVTGTGVFSGAAITFDRSGRLANVGALDLCVAGQQRRNIRIMRSGAAMLTRTQDPC
jgi:type IV fimbrial biogenesis protein FimT